MSNLSKVTLWLKTICKNHAKKHLNELSESNFVKVLEFVSVWSLISVPSGTFWIFEDFLEGGTFFDKALSSTYNNNLQADTNSRMNRPIWDFLNLAWVVFLTWLEKDPKKPKSLISDLGIMARAGSGEKDYK